MISVLIIGGGVNGAGLLRELALQGVDALLVEKSDFCAGASAAGTRLIHGGLRYLENAEFRLVREALRERGRLLRNAPHYVKPLAVTMPLFDRTSGLIPAARRLLGRPATAGGRGALIVKTGLLAYDLLAGRASGLPHHRFSSRSKALALRPALNPGVLATATFWDARISSPERLCLELILDAEGISPEVRALNYVRVQGASGDTVFLHDETTGETREVRPRVVVNATGAWIDLTNRALGRESCFIGGAKGSHLVLDHPELAAAAAGEMIYFANSDGRILMLYPTGGRILAGTTDIPTDDPDEVCDETEASYILDAIQQVFPSIRADHSHVVFRFCGVRPLPRSAARSPGEISRDHSRPLLAPAGGIKFPVYSLVGGKWTTFRAFAEQTAGEILRVLGRRRIRSSANLAIGGGKGYPPTGDAREGWLARLQQETGLPAGRLEALLDRYGTRAGQVAAHLVDGPDCPLTHGPGYSRREIDFLVRRERVVRLDDLLLRRTLIGFYGESTQALLEELASIAAPALGWTPETAQQEVARTARLLMTVHGVSATRLERR